MNVPPASPASPAGAAGSAEIFVETFTEGWRAPAGGDEFADFFEPHFTDDVRMIQPQLPVLVGKRAFREQFARPTFKLIPDLHADVHDWSASDAGTVVFINFTLSGTLGGRPVSWPCVDRIVTRGGLVAERRAYFDPGPLLKAVLTRPRAWPTFTRIRLPGGN